MWKRFVACGLVLSAILGFFPSGPLAPATAQAYASDLIISEYIEGSSNNKAVELYNGTGAPVDLSLYQLEWYANGGTTASVLTLSGTLAAGDVFVAVHSSAVQAMKDIADVATTTVNHNGDDAIVLRRGTAVVDSFGQVGFRPSGGWGNPVITVDRTLVRKAAITAGDTNSGDVFDPVVEWDEYAKDTFTYLGSHTMNSVPTKPAAPTGLQALPGNGMVTLTWTASTTPGVATYSVERATAAEGPFSQIATPTATTYTDTGLTNGTTYWYQVVALDGSNNASDPSNAVSAMPVAVDETPPVLGALAPVDGATELQPETLSVSAAFAEPVTLADGSAAGDVTGVTTTVDGTPIDGVTAALVSNVITVTIPGGATYGKTYQVTIPAAAVKDANNVPSTEVTWSFTTRPILPISQARTYAAGTKVTVQGVIIGDFGYEVFLWDGTAALAARHGLLDGYTVGDEILLTGNLALYSTQLQIGTADQVAKVEQVHPVPAPLEVTTADLMASPFNRELYEGRLVKVTDLAITALTPASNGNSYTAKGQQNGVEIDIRIDKYAAAEPKVINGFHTAYKVGDQIDLVGIAAVFNSGYQIKPRTMDDLSAPIPTGLLAAPADGQVTLTWTAGSNLQGYRVYRALDEAGPYELLNPDALIPTVSYVDSTVTNDTTYWYKVSAVNAMGESKLSAAVSALPEAIDMTSPVVQGLEPADNAANVALAAPIAVTFAEDVIQTGDVIGVTVTAGGEPVNGATAALSGRTVTVTVPGGLVYDTAYTVAIAAGAVKDINEVPSDEIRWSFRTRREYMTIAEARAQATGTVTVQGVVTASFGREVYMQDETGAIVVYADAVGTYVEGDEIRVTGGLEPYYGLLEIRNTVTAILVGKKPVPAPLELTSSTVTVAQEGQLVRVPGLVLNTYSPNASSSYNVTTQGVQLRIDAYATALPDLHDGFAKSFKAGDTVDVVGVVARYNTTPQLKPRRLTDVVNPNDLTPPVITHTVPASASEGANLALQATVTDNVYILEAMGYYKVGSVAFTPVPLTLNAGKYEMTIPKANLFAGAVVEYYFTANDGRQTARLPEGTNLFAVTVIPDKTGPEFTAVTPADGTKVFSRRPEVKAAFQDVAGIDQASISLKLDGTDVTAKAQKSAGLVTYVPAQHLALGTHEAQVTVRDTLGNQSSRTWTFTVEASDVPLVVISELFVDPRSSNDAEEFISIVNTDAVTVDLSGWTLTTVTSSGTVASAAFPAGVTIAPDQMLVVANNGTLYRDNVAPHANSAAVFESGATASGFGTPMVRSAGTLTLANTSGTVILANAAGTEADVVRYKSCTTSSCQTEAPYTGTGWSGPVVRWPITDTFETPGQLLARAISEQTITATYAGTYKADSNTADDWLSAGTDSAGGWYYWQKPGSPGGTPLANRYYTAGQMHSLPLPTWQFEGTVTTFLGPDSSFDTIARLFYDAQATIDLNMYEFELYDWARVLVDAANRGVQVRVLIEGQVCCESNNSDQTKYLAKLMNDAGVAVQFMQEDPAAGHYRRYSNVNHAKYAVVDGGRLMVFSGNFKTSSTSENPSSGNREWGIIIDNVETAQYFANIFSFDFDPAQPDTVPYGYQCVGTGCDGKIAPVNYTPDLATDGDPEGPYHHPFGARTIQGQFAVTPVLVPETNFLDHHSILGMIKHAQKSIMLEWATLNKYWASGNPETTPMPLVAELVNAARRGVQVRVLLENKYGDTGGKTNPETVAYLNQIAMAEGLDMQARLLGYANGNEFPGYDGLHNKGIVVDERFTLISSINGTQASWLRNREAALIIENAEAAEYYLNCFWYDWYDGQNPQEWPVISEVSVEGGWVELYNPTSEPVTLGGYKLASGAGEWTIPAGTVLPANQTLVFSGQAPVTAEDVTGMTLTFSASGDMVRLLTPAYEKQDEVAWNRYLPDWTVMLPAGQSLIRTNACRDTNSWVDWSAGAAQPGLVTCTTQVPFSLSGNSNLSALSIDGVSIAPSFMPGYTRYHAAVPTGTTSVTITAAAAHAGASVAINGTVGTALTVELTAPITVVPVDVTAANGAVRTYQIGVERPMSANADLAGLVVSTGTMIFNPATQPVTASAAYVKATLADPNATMTINGRPATSGRAVLINLALGTNPVIVAITAEDGVTTKIYKIDITRVAPSTNANLASLTVSPGALAFNAATTSYTASVPYTTTSVFVTAKLADSKATVTIGGAAATSGTGRMVALALGTNTIPVVVTAEDGKTTKTYTITVVRAAAPRR